MESKTIYMHDKILSIILEVFAIIFLLTSIVFILLGINDTNWLIAGCVFSLLWVILFILIVCGKTILNLITFNKEIITLKTIFGKVLKLKKWSEFRKCEIIKLSDIRPSVEYICLLFNEAEIKTNRYCELNEDENIIIIIYNEKNHKLLNNFIDSKR